MNILTDKIVKTRRAHRCHGCRGEIVAGSVAQYQVTVDDGEFLSAYFCNVCIEYMSRLIFDGDDGICEGELKENDHDGWEAVRLELEEKAARMNEFNLEARWVKFAERWPKAEEAVLARDFAGNTIGADYAEDDECYVVFNGEYHIRRDELNGWEWLEVREKGGE